jgi:putative transcriptional regulator
MQLREVPFVPNVLYEKKMTERNLFAEMTEGFDDLAAAREGKKTLLTTEVEIKSAVELSA